MRTVGYRAIARGSKDQNPARERDRSNQYTRSHQHTQRYGLHDRVHTQTHRHSVIVRPCDDAATAFPGVSARQCVEPSGQQRGPAYGGQTQKKQVKLT
uniref:Uncharacterized protein n=1 Tax=Anopheles arabiensis TaxID=7173 RepID=A0A182HW86_ANOAR